MNAFNKFFKFLRGSSVQTLKKNGESKFGQSLGFLSSMSDHKRVTETLLG